MWLKKSYAPISAASADGQNPLAQKERLEEEKSKFRAHVENIKGTKVRWLFRVCNLTIEGFTAPCYEEFSDSGGKLTGQFKMYRESQPKIETKGLIFTETVDHQIGRFEVNRDISAERFKRITPKSKIVIEANLHDVTGFMNGQNACFDFVLVNARVADE